MNRILPIKGAVTAPGDAPMAEANRSQQQRFEQAMRLEQEQKATYQHRANGQSKTQEPRLQQLLQTQEPQPQPQPQQLLQTQQQKKQAADTARQPDISASHSQSKQLQTQPFITREASGLSAPAISEVTARDQKEIESKKSQKMLDTQDKKLEDGTRGVELPAPENSFLAPSSMVNTPTPRLPLEGAGGSAPESALATLPSLVKEQVPHPKQEGHDSQQHDMQVTGITAGAEVPPGAEQAALQQGGASLPEDVEFVERKASDTVINELTLTDEMPEAGDQLIPPQVKTPGDLQLARMAPAESNRELGQLLERLAVDIYQELGSPERPPLLRLTLPALGELAIRIEHHHGEMQIEILATTQGELLLNQGRSELIDRLQRLHPGERVTLDLFSQPDRDQGSRQQRSIYDEWDADA